MGLLLALTGLPPFASSPALAHMGPVDDPVFLALIVFVIGAPFVGLAHVALSAFLIFTRPRFRAGRMICGACCRTLTGTDGVRCPFCHKNLLEVGLDCIERSVSRGRSLLRIAWTLGATFLIPGCLLALLGAMLMDGQRSIVFATVPITALPYMLVGALLVQRHTRGVGDEPLCGRCGYNLRGQTDPRCPECGGAFHEVGVLRHGPPRRRPVVAIVVWGLCALYLGGISFALMLNMLGLTSWL